MSTAEAPASRGHQSARRAGTAGMLGTMIEAYDFAIYTYLVVFTAPLFFPADNPSNGVLAALLALGAGFLARPVGGLFFGRLGDRRGRRFALIATVVTMGTATFVIGLLPTYATIGVLAPVLLVALRLLQGFSAGGELMGSATFVTEHGTRRNHGFLSAITPLGNALGAALAPAVVGVVTLVIADDIMGAWGWRIPLLLSLPLTVLVLVLRTRLDDSPEFKRSAEREETASRTPVRDVVRQHPLALARVVVLAASVLFIGYFSAAYLPIYLQTAGGLSPGEAARFASVGMISAMPCMLLTGKLVDRYGRQRVQILLLVLAAVVVFPMMAAVGAPEGAGVLGVAGFIVFVCIGGSVAVPAFASFTASFPTRVRYTGAALGYGLGGALGAGFGPYLSALSAELTGSRYASAALLLVVAAVGLVVAATMRDTTAAPTADPVPAVADPDVTPA
ncbi:MFS transporter [Actinomycetospora aeridis]|uniref:MFS transporter n=1 Tax=Actinomycetospora aeridis TaxID=3129231 RepID=A0ABU8NE08_9PSEU